MINILIVDDHELVGQAIIGLLKDKPDFNVVGFAKSGEKAIELARKNILDVVLLDLKMPGIGGLETIRRLIRLKSDLKVLILTAYAEHPFPFRALQAGASGYLTKNCSIDEMIQAIRTIYLGQRHISSEIAQQLAFRSVSDEPVERAPFDVLSERELQIMMMLANGLKVGEISEKLFINSKTVNSYRYRLFDKLKVKSDVELTHIAIKYKMVEIVDEELV